MADKAGLDDKPHELNLGASFKSNVAFHAIRYDFKPASADHTRMSAIEIGENNSATVTVPHVPGSGATHTVYKGNKRPCQKECVLIIDHSSGEITLEKLASTIQLKKTRLDGSSKVMQNFRPVTPVEQKSQREQKAASPKPQAKASPPPTQQQEKVKHKPPAAHTATHTGQSKGSSQSAALSDTLSSSCSSDSDSDSDSNASGNNSSDEEEPQPVKETKAKEAPVSAPVPVAASHPATFTSLINDDLRLSESSSDSD